MSKKPKNNHRRRRKKSSAQVTAEGRKSELSALIDEVSVQKNASASTADRNEDQQLIDRKIDPEFISIFQRFEASKETNKSDSVPQSGVVSVSKFSPPANDLDDYSDDAEAERPKSKRKAAKPSLSTLKSISTHPDLIQWYDCDSPEPFFLVKIKSAKNIVPIPSHWQAKRGYLSGRSLLEKKPFELPDVIKQTDIESMRNTVLGSGEDGSSLKKDARSRVQPKLGRLDLDYVKMHDAFFKLGRHWRPELMLTFGDLYYENRNLEQELSWTRMRRKYKPGKLSLELRNAMGLPEGRPPIWCKKWKDIGLPPAYPGFKVAGINWDASNVKAGRYGIWKNQEQGEKVELFGQLLSFEKENQLLEREKDRRTNSKGIVDHQPTIVTDEVIQEPLKDIPIDAIPVTEIHETATNKATEERSYTTLEENKRSQDPELLLKGGYNTAGKRKKQITPDVNPKRHQFKSVSKDEDTIDNFKF
ncbi:U2 snRNP complex subunit CUS1 Ecym_1483 [Eremothecium cymbalariae DBVPG|uniref:PSP proline-rich domain-containing protein n=1 Tax=Eremothecium cymbalariae (strain CBS 270.75 / DBVPG 7215 / KCTC 17166 / NRRL Y-17582) TaxID=931890 RepID=G8JMJ1_ERECY|nr:hypothetical protein Ecym_1483 [Eremothecium cymbalariae DBVPG\